VLLPDIASVGSLRPRHNALLKAGQKSDKIDARRLAELPRATS
jgi:hypothetical protein